MRWPSGENAALRDSLSMAFQLRQLLPVAAFQTRAVLSSLAVTMRWPSGENAALSTESVWPSSFRQLLPSGRVPDPRRLIIARGDDALAVRGERGAVDSVSMAFQLCQQLASGRVPHPCRPILARGDDALAVRGERGAVDRLSMAFQRSPAAAQ